jgi:hypothetical protein
MEYRARVLTSQLELSIRPRVASKFDARGEAARAGVAFL